MIFGIGKRNATTKDFPILGTVQTLRLQINDDGDGLFLFLFVQVRMQVQVQVDAGADVRLFHLILQRNPK